MAVRTTTKGSMHRWTDGYGYGAIYHTPAEELETMHKSWRFRDSLMNDDALKRPFTSSTVESSRVQTAPADRLQYRSPSSPDDLSLTPGASSGLKMLKSSPIRSQSNRSTGRRSRPPASGGRTNQSNQWNTTAGDGDPSTGSWMRPASSLRSSSTHNNLSRAVHAAASSLSSSSPASSRGAGLRGSSSTPTLPVATTPGGSVATPPPWRSDLVQQGPHHPHPGASARGTNTGTGTRERDRQRLPPVDGGSPKSSERRQRLFSPVVEGGPATDSTNQPSTSDWSKLEMLSTGSPFPRNAKFDLLTQKGIPPDPLLGKIHPSHAIIMNEKNHIKTHHWSRTLRGQKF